MIPFMMEMSNPRQDAQAQAQEFMKFDIDWRGIPHLIRKIIVSHLGSFYSKNNQLLKKEVTFTRFY